MVDKINQRDLVWLKRANDTLKYLCSDLLGIPLQTGLTRELIGSLKDKLTEREESRKKKDWKSSDLIRKEIESMGSLVEDTSRGPVVKPKH